MTLAQELTKHMRHCALCPRACGVNRLRGQQGFCRSGSGLAISALTVHKGEEPVLSGEQGICNVFFSHCNLQCVYCQNWQISRNATACAEEISLEAAVERIQTILASGIKRLGFVSPSHMVPQMLTLVEALWRRGLKPIIAYNSGGYDSVAALKMLEGLVDIYLPDCKYMDSRLAASLSGARDYPEKAAAALGEMYRQMGSVVQLDDEGLALRGLIVRHLVLPGQTANSLAVLRFVARELSPKVMLSLMAQYGPTPHTAHVRGFPELSRPLLPGEYHEVWQEMRALGFTQGFLQELASADTYRPDFSKEEPFAAG